MSAGNEFYRALYYWEWHLHDFWTQVAIAALLMWIARLDGNGQHRYVCGNANEDEAFCFKCTLDA